MSRSHACFAVNLEVVWDTVHERFPKEKPRLQQLVDELPDGKTCPFFLIATAFLCKI